MPSKIRPDKPLGKEVRRIAAAYLERARSELTDKPDGPHEAIHTARKQFKRVRGLYRLVASGDGAFQKAENERIGNMARGLSAARDQTTLIETARRLAIAADTADEHMAVIRICERLVERRDAAPHMSEENLEKAIAGAIVTCGEALEALDRLDLDTTPKGAADLLGDGWRGTGKKALAALASAHDGGEAESFHTLRKRSQDRWMQCGFLEQAWPSMFKAARIRAKQLVDALGEKQDISVLNSFLDSQSTDLASADDTAHLIAVMIREGERRRNEALKLAADVFDGTPKRDGDLVAKIWRRAARGR